MTWRILTVLPYLAAAIACIALGIRRQRRAATNKRMVAERAALPAGTAGVVFKPFSVFVNGAKLGTATRHDIYLGADQSTLTVTQLVPCGADVPSALLLKQAFGAAAPVDVVVGPIAGDTVNLGKMRILHIEYSTDFKTGVTKSIAYLSGPSIVDIAKVRTAETFGSMGNPAERNALPQEAS